MDVQVVAQVFPVALLLFALRGICTVIGSFIGARWGGTRMGDARRSGLVFLTQAGVALAFVKDLGLKVSEKSADQFMPAWLPQLQGALMAAIRKWPPLSSSVCCRG